MMGMTYICVNLPSIQQQNFANVNKANNLLGWKAELTIEDMCRDAFKFIASI